MKATIHGRRRAHYERPSVDPSEVPSEQEVKGIIRTLIDEGLLLWTSPVSVDEWPDDVPLPVVVLEPYEES